MTAAEKDAARQIATIISLHFEHFIAPDKIRLLESLSILLPNDEAIAASQAAFMLRKAEDHQLKFHDLLRTTSATT